MQKVLIAAAFAALAASPALAGIHGQHARTRAQAEGAYAFSPADPTAVVVDGKIIGRDPDPFIRLQILRAGDPEERSGGR